MRILYVSHCHPSQDNPLENIGGMQNVSEHLLKNLEKQKNVDIDTIILRTSWKNIVPKTFFYLIRLLWKIPIMIRENNPDVVLFSSMVTACTAPFLCLKKDIPLITINHGQDVTLPCKLYQWYLPTVFRHLNGVISVSDATKEQCIQRGMDAQKGVVIPNGIELHGSSIAPDKTTAKKKLEKKFGINLKDSKLLISVGRQVKRKGHSWFVEDVMDKLPANVKLLLIGDGPESDNIKRSVENSVRKNDIILAGQQPHGILNTAYEAADLFVMPNIPVEGDMEGFGIVILEANRSGVPVVASNIEGIQDVIEDGKNGYKILSNSPDLFAKKIVKVLNGELKNLSENSIKHVSTKFSWNVVIQQYLAYLKRQI